MQNLQNEKKQTIWVCQTWSALCNIEKVFFKVFIWIILWVDVTVLNGGRYELLIDREAMKSFYTCANMSRVDRSYSHAQFWVPEKENTMLTRNITTSITHLFLINVVWTTLH